MDEIRHTLRMSRQTYDFFGKENPGRSSNSLCMPVVFDDNLDFGTAVLTDGNQILWVGSVLKRKSSPVDEDGHDAGSSVL